MVTCRCRCTAPSPGARAPENSGPAAPTLSTEARWRPNSSLRRRESEFRFCVKVSPSSKVADHFFHAVVECWTVGRRMWKKTENIFFGFGCRREIKTKKVKVSPKSYRGTLYLVEKTKRLRSHKKLQLEIAICGNDFIQMKIYRR
jgi:hypothetical protein